jgi:hypothetical protein
VLFSLVSALSPTGVAAYFGGAPTKHASARHHSDDTDDSGRSGRTRQNAGCGKVITSLSRIHEAWEQARRDNRPVCVRVNNQTLNGSSWRSARDGRRGAG